MTVDCHRRRSHRLIWGLVLVGILLRTWHFLRNPSMWHDEAALVMNVLWLDFSELLGPLVWHEAAPPLFLWMERALALTLGDNLFVLRLLPYLASCASLMMMVPISRRLLSEKAIPFAILLFALSDSLLFHACEAKPYALDVFGATLMLTLFVSRSSLQVKLWITLALTPILIFMSYPACFVLGAILLAWLPHAFQSRRIFLTYSSVGTLVVVCFLILVLGPVRAQRDPVIESDWVGYFPDWSEPLSVPGWLIIRTSEAFRYCFKPWGMVFPLLALVGAWVMWNRKQTLIALAGPFLLMVLASLMGGYPLGARRVVIFAAPGLALLIAAAIPALMERMRFRWGPLLLVVLVSSVGINAIRRTVKPWPRPQCQEVAKWICQQRQSSEKIVSNDWTYHYYLRHLGETHRLGRVHQSSHDPVALKSNHRYWIVHNSLKSVEQRKAEARTFCPVNWSIVRSHEFRYTTVLLVEPRLNALE